MARPSARRAQTSTALKTLTAAGVPDDVAARVVASGAGAEFAASAALTGSAAVFKPGRKSNHTTDRGQIAQWWQHEAYRHVHICGEARYAAVLYSNTAGRAEIGVSEAQSLARKAIWVTEGPEVDVLAEIAPTVRDRTKLIRDFMLHWVIAGEALDVDTPVATPEGFTRMGDLAPGDVILGGDGKPTMVTHAHPVQEGRPTYEVTLTSGARVVADAEHLWAVRDRGGRELGYGEKVLTTEQIRANLKDKKGRYNYTIDMTAVEGEYADLPADPYLLGYWLGDGTTVQSSITAHPEDQHHLRVQVEKVGYQMTTRGTRGYHVGITGGFLQDLRAAGVLGQKHIPGEYLRASREQRLALLQGLIDSDGHIDKEGRGEFSNTNKELLLGFIELASSLGMRVGQPRRNRVGFSPCGVQAARLPRKAERIKAWSNGDQWRSIVSIEPVTSRPVRCITVDSPDQTFLVTEHMVKTHNCYLIARERTDTDPASRSAVIWEIVAVTELRKIGETWSVRHDNNNYIDLHASDPVIRLWNPDPENRREAWSPFKSLLPTLREIEWLTKHIFTQVRSRLLGAGVWFLPENLTFAPPPPESVEGGAEAIAQMNEAEQFMISLADSSMNLLESDEVGFPSVVMADAAALANIDQAKLIQFWSEIDMAAMTMRTENIRRFALGMDLPSGKAVDPVTVASGANGGSGGANHWGKWAEQEEMISEHIEPALDAFTGSLTTALLWLAVPDSDKIIAYDSASMRLRQDLSKPAMEWYDRGELKADVALRETGFDPDNDKMDDAEFRRWILKKMVSGNPSPEMVHAAASMLSVVLPVTVSEKPGEIGGGTPGSAQPRSLEEHPYTGPPREQHDHSPAPYSSKVSRVAEAEGLVLRALEKAGNRLLNTGYRGRSKPTGITPFAAHVEPGVWDGSEVTFDFTTASVVFEDMEPRDVGALTRELAQYCAHLYRNGLPYSRASMVAYVGGL